LSKQQREKHPKNGKATMTVISHNYTTISPEGMYQIGVRINGKGYTYYLTSEYAYRKFIGYYIKGYYGKALKTLNQFKTIMEVTEDE